MYKKILFLCLFSVFLYPKAPFSKQKLQKVIIKYVAGTFNNKIALTNGVKDDVNNPSTLESIYKTPGYIYLTLDYPVSIKEVHIYWGNNKIDFPVELSTSSDYLIWQKIDNKPHISKTTSSITKTIFDVDNITANYIRIFIPRQSSDTYTGAEKIQITEVEVFTESTGELEFKEVGTTQIGETFAQVACKLNQVASVQVYYGLDLERLYAAPLSFSAAKEHKYTLNGPTPGTRYLFQFQASKGKEIVKSRYYYFTTRGEAPLHFSAINATPDTNYATIRVVTNKPVTIRLHYEEINPLNKILLGAELPKKKAPIVIKNYSPEHKITLKDLHPGWKYNFQIEAFSKKKETALSRQQSFYTKLYNVAFKRPVRGTFTNLPKDRFIPKEPEPLKRLTDGKYSYFSSTAQSGNINIEDQYAVVDLGKIYEIFQVNLIFRKLAYPNVINILGSTDGKNYFELAKNLDAKMAVISPLNQATP